MKVWYLVGNLGGMKMLYYVGKFETEEEAKAHAVTRYKVKKSRIASLVMEAHEN
jgi:hypothetical protein